MKGKRILLVEDNEINRKLITRILTNADYQVAIAENGVESLQLLEEEPNGFDIILMDIQMPVMDGYEATRRIKADDKIKDIPVIALTAHAMKGDEEKVLDAGCDGYLTKPIKKEDLLSEISRQMGVNEEVDDTQGFQASTGGAASEEFEDIQRDYFESLPGEFDRLSTAIDGEDYETVCRIGHDMKGTGGAFGKEKISIIGRQIETAAREKNIEVVSFLLNSLKEEIDRILSEL